MSAIGSWTGLSTALSYRKARFLFSAKAKTKNHKLNKKEIPLMAEQICSEDPQPCSKLFTGLTFGDMIATQQNCILLINHDLMIRRSSITYSANKRAGIRSVGPRARVPK